jgi:hypothetical protein
VKEVTNYEFIHIDGQDGKDICFASQKLNLVNHVKKMNYEKIFKILELLYHSFRNRC